MNWMRAIIILLLGSFILNLMFAGLEAMTIPTSETTLYDKLKTNPLDLGSWGKTLSWDYAAFKEPGTNTPNDFALIKLPLQFVSTAFFFTISLTFFSAIAGLTGGIIKLTGFA